MPFVKTSGGKGIHVVVPVKPKLDWKKLHQATSAIADATCRHGARHLHHHDGQGQPQEADLHRFSPQRARPHVGRALFAARAYQPAGVDAGNWADLESIDAPEDLNYSSLPGLLATSGDPWADIDEFARDLPVCRQAGK